MTSIDIYTILSSKPHNPHYLQRYIKFIQVCIKSNTIEENFIKHHICPKAKELFPEYTSLNVHVWNCARLTNRQHFIAHWLLWKTYMNRSMTISFKLMNKNATPKRISSRVFAKLREEFVKSVSGENSFWFRSGYVKQVHVAKKSQIGYVNPAKGRKSTVIPWNKGKIGVQTHTEETLEKFKIIFKGENNGMFGKYHTLESRILIGSYDKAGENNGMFGKHHSETTKIKQSEVWKHRNMIECPHCSQQSINAANMKRWHFDNCKLAK